MRTYPRNSPEAAARIVALVLISDGHVSPSEIHALRQLGFEQELGLPSGAFSQVVFHLCEDLLSGSVGPSAGVCSVDNATLACMLAEVDEPDLQSRVLRMASAAAEADSHLADAEAILVGAALLHWKIGLTAS